MGFDPSPMMAAAAAWWAAASERGAPSDVAVTFSSSRRFRQAALGFRFLSGGRNKEEEVIISVSVIFCLYKSVFWLCLLFSQGGISLCWINKSAMRLKPKTLAWLNTINRWHCCPLLELQEHWIPPDLPWSSFEVREKGNISTLWPENVLIAALFHQMEMFCLSSKTHFSTILPDIFGVFGNLECNLYLNVLSLNQHRFESLNKAAQHACDLLKQLGTVVSGKH